MAGCIGFSPYIISRWLPCQKQGGKSRHDTRDSS